MANFSKHTGKITWANDSRLKAARNNKENPIVDNKAKMIGPAGQVVEISLATGRGIPENRNMYKAQILAEKQRKGWVLYDSLSDSKREKLIAERKARHAEKEAQFAERAMGSEERIVEAISRLAGANEG